MAEKTVKVSDFLNDKLIFLNQTFKSADELFDKVAEFAERSQMVNESFLPKIKEREATFPTGLELEDRGVAIPHTDADTIKQEFVAVITNKDGIPFKRMDDPNQLVSAKIVFVLGLNQPHAQLEMLQALMSVIQDRSVLDQIQSATSANEIKEILK
ncbi:PTS sugar transporter subunit IIA [Lacticaseibacillus chiayiensis]|uniref:PTS sugar transporter subunit IIA n=1 Tax=Lacticaseibacillus chiayiensis TaxID=2100821 RepID=UPI0010107B81|nr:PTS sugar transporter subunit IIA [Lacticaseibacillus chiayiensis]QVI34609.1 PTS sugar transporter subunit IIA [Lacticaseibacillus chiayiensis]RXT59008.1 PTS fructose transporter subunit IIA [Lacticaseibacillus chiayiensis]